MKKFLNVSVVVLFLVLIAGCQPKTSASASFFDVDVQQTTIVLSIEISDHDEEITGIVTVKLLRPDGTVVNSKQIVEEIDLLGITFSALDNTLEYTVEVHATVGRNSIVIGTASYALLTAQTIHITTPEQFMNMNTNRSGNYVLDNDIDFADETFISPFTASFSGTFDGQGFAIKNVTFTTISTYTGLFGYVSSGTIKNLVIDHVSIGSLASPLAMTTSTRVGILAGYVSSSTSVIENIVIKNSTIHYTSSSTVQAVAGGAVGELRASLTNVTLENVSVHVTSTSYGKIKVGGVVGYVAEDGRLKEVTSDTDVYFTMSGNALKNRDLQINVGGVVGDHNGRNFNKSIENIVSTGDINVELDFGTSPLTTSGNYAVYVGGLIGFSQSHITDAFYMGSILVSHEKNDHEEEVGKSVFVGGLVGYYLSNKVADGILRLGNGQTIDVNMSDDVNVKASQTFGGIKSTATHRVGIFGETHLDLNDVSQVDNDLSIIYLDLTDFFTSTWIQDAYDRVHIAG